MRNPFFMMHELPKIKTLLSSYENRKDTTMSVESWQRMKLILEKMPLSYIFLIKETNVPFLSKAAYLVYKKMVKTNRKIFFDKF